MASSMTLPSASVAIAVPVPNLNFAPLSLNFDPLREEVPKKNLYSAIAPGQISNLVGTAFNSPINKPILLPVRPINSDLLQINDTHRAKLKCLEFPIKENSVFRKLLACIPLFGVIPTMINECSLQKKIGQTTLPERQTKLIEVKNHYKICSIVREVLTLALVIAVAGIVAIIAMNILCLSIGLAAVAGAAIIGGASVGIYAYGIYKNKQLIKELENSGLTPQKMCVR
jgi:hypothetical protein